MFHTTDKTRKLSIICILGMLGLLLANCAPITNGVSIFEDTETPTPTVVPVPGATTPPDVTLEVSSNATLGSFLTDQIGFTLYAWKKDTAGISNCTGACLQTWPPLMTLDAPKVGDPSIKGKVGVINRPDGGQQVTYNGMPLYFYIKDNIPGDAIGQGVTNDWYVVAP